MAKKYDFAGWASRNDLRCSDGRTIRRDAFKDCDGQIVPLVWNHQHNDSDNVLGHALLENRPEGIYSYCSFNDTEKGQNAKLLVQHGDITGLSIYANKLKQVGGDVLHGVIREVSLVLAGANPGAFIDSVMAHGEDSEEEAVIYTGEELDLDASEQVEEEQKVEENVQEEKSEETNENKDVIEHSEKEKEEMPENNEKTVQDVIDTMTEEQKNVMYALVGMAAEDNGKEDEDEDMKHNVFDNDLRENEDVISHSDLEMIATDAKRLGSLKDAFLAHGIEHLEYIAPEYKNIRSDIPFINTQPSGWIDVVLNGVHHTPFAKVKMVFADITMDTARAKGYIQKGTQKRDEVFKLLHREVDPTTIYKKQSFDRDDVIDITDLDLISWVKKEMRVKLDEERARAYIFGDGRTVSDPDKIDDSKIIPVILDTEENLYAMKVEVQPKQDEELGKALIRALVKGMDNYEGSGNVTAFLRADLVSDLLLLEDKMGHRLYKNVTDLASAMAVEKVVKVPASIVPEGFYGVALDLKDYNVGTNKGGQISMFDDFDIDYNKMKYLIETRQSGALILPHSAVVLVEGEEAADEENNG